MNSTFMAKNYMKLSQDDLVTVALDAVIRSGQTPTFERLVAKCYELFPQRFSLRGYPQWPNAVVVNKAWLRCRTDKKLMTGSVADGFKLTPKGLEVVKKTLDLLEGQSTDAVEVAEAKKSRVDKQTLEGRIATRVEHSAAYKKFLETNSLEPITEYELCDLLYGTMESTPDTLAKNYETIKQHLSAYGRKDLLSFMEGLHNKFPHRFLVRMRPGGMLPRRGS